MRKTLVSFLLCAVLLLAFFLLSTRSGRHPLKRASSSFESLISAERIEKQNSELASKPHRAGTEENIATGNKIIQRLKSAGLEVATTEYQVELPEPLQSKLQLVFPQSIEFEVREKELPSDPYSRIASSDIPYFAFSPDAELEAEVVYANFGSLQDYELLKRKGIELAGKIALVRAQGICRGMKLLNAEEQGLAGLLLFPELRDQGFRKPPYPEGPQINPSVIQRGSMLKFFQYPGDPFDRKGQTESTLPKIPSLPISQEIAMELLKRIQGPASPEEWRGWLPVNYNLGAGPARVKLILRSQLKRRVIRNILATIPGTNPLEPSIMIGGHYDAWVYGAADPSSGTSVLLEVANTLSRLEKKWWNPRRNVVFAFWDAEEFGLFGSTKWVESALQDPSKKVVAYLNVDTAVQGEDFAGYLMPGLRGPLDEVLKLVKDPITGEPLSERRGEFANPGFSVDTAPFNGLAGIPVAEIHFGRYYPMYHSIYDNLAWMNRFDDPGYKLSATLSRVLCLYLFKLSNDQIFPFQFEELTEYTRGSLSRMIPKELEIDPGISQKISGLKEAMSRFDQAFANFQRISQQKKFVKEVVAQETNDLLLSAYSSFTRKGASSEQFGDYARRNALLGPSEKEGCAGQELPGLGHALRMKDPARIKQEIQRLTDSFITSGKILFQAMTKMEK
jgi:N-acetylated-alpha-linked acidic dipeptidase